jgi:20S proteasome subunit beta 3
MKPTTFCNLVAYTLFERRFGSYYVQPIVAGLEDGEAVLASYDSIGAQCMIERFEVAGTASEELMAICEANYRDGMAEDELGFKLHQILTSACDRDMYSGWGGIVYLITKEGIKTTFLKTKET